MKSYIKNISFHLPEYTLTNDELCASFPDWNIDMLYKSTGVKQRQIADKNETASDLAVKATEKLFSEFNIDRNEIDFILFCTVSPDYILPTTACIIQDRLNIPKNAGVIDYNHGCSGYVYGLMLADGLVKSGTAKNILLITAETITRYINEKDRGLRFIIGDGAAASLISNEPGELSFDIGKFIFGSDGSGFSKIMIKCGRARHPLNEASNDEIHDEYGNIRTEKDFYMNGNDVFIFAISVVPKIINQLLEKSNTTIDKIDYFVFHQANKKIIESIGKKLRIPDEKLIFDMENIGNTGASSIPIALANSINKGVFKKSDKLLLAGFGVGLSWSATIVDVV